MPTYLAFDAGDLQSFKHSPDPTCARTLVQHDLAALGSSAISVKPSSSSPTFLAAPSSPTTSPPPHPIRPRPPSMVTRPLTPPAPPPSTPLPPSSTHYAKINGATLHYAVAGSPTSTPFVVLHGGRGFSDHRSDFGAFQSMAKTHFLIGIDQRGHGLSSAEAPITFDQLAADIEEFRHVVLSGRKIVLEGGSFGGMMAQLYACTYPDSLEALILRGTAPSHHHEEAAMANLKARIKLATNASVGMLEKVFSDTVADDVEWRLIMFAIGPFYSESYDPDRALASSVRAYPRAKTHNALYSKGEKFFDYRERLRVVGQKGIRVLLVVGEKDWICPPEQSKEIKRCIALGGGPEPELHVVPHANHSVHLEKPELVMGLVRTFLGV